MLCVSNSMRLCVAKFYDSSVMLIARSYKRRERESGSVLRKSEEEQRGGSAPSNRFVEVCLSAPAPKSVETPGNGYNTVIRVRRCTLIFAQLRFW